MVGPTVLMVTKGNGAPGAPGLVEEDELVGGRTPLASELGGPADAEPAVLADLADHLEPGVAPLAAVGQTGADLVVEQVGVVAAQFGAQLLLLGALFEEHRGAASRAVRGPCQVKAALGKNVTRSRFGGTGRAAGPGPPGRRGRSRGGSQDQRGDAARACL